MTEQEFAQLLVPRHEQSGVEFKSSGSKDDKSFLVKIIRATIGMANRRDGGIVIIGVKEDSNRQPEVVGMVEEHLKSWQFDSFSDSLAEYAEPVPQFEFEPFDYQSLKLVAIRVSEFDETPIICKRDYPQVLRAGAYYVRTRRKPETVEVPTYIDMRGLMELAIEKGVRKFVSQAYRAGLAISNLSETSDATLFRNQIADLL